MRSHEGACTNTLVQPCDLSTQELECLTNDLRDFAGLKRSEVVDAGEFAVRLLGPDSIVIVDELEDGARLRQTGKGYCIELRNNLSDINFRCANEIGRWALREFRRYNGPDEKHYAGYVGAALLMPRRLVIDIVQYYGRIHEAISPLAIQCEVSKTSAQLRIAEVLGDERAVVTKNGNVIVRNAARIDWKDPAIKEMRRSGVHHLRLSKTRLDGGIDTGRVALTLRNRE